MSKFNPRSLAVCVAAALALPVTAMAATFNFTGAPINNTYASNLFGSTAVTVTTPGTLAYNTELTDNIIGRTTGFGVRLTLVGGPTFVTGTPPVASLGAAATGYTPGAATVSGAVATFPFAAGAGANINVGNLVNVGTFAVAGASGILANGGEVTLRIELFDSNTNQVLTDLTRTMTLMNAVEGTTVTFTPAAGDVNKRIDVAACASPAVAAKTQFSPSGDVSGSCGATGNSYFNAGSFRLSTTEVGGGNFVLANGFTGNNNSGSPGAGYFQYFHNDEVEVTVSGVDFSAFDVAGADRVWVDQASNCSSLRQQLTVNAAKTAATGTISFNFGGGGAWGNTINTWYICFNADPARQAELAAQPINLTVGVHFLDTNVRDPADRTAAMLPLLYNGTVLEFQNVNPGSNPRAQSFLRFTNNSATNCPVTLRGRDDEAVYGDSTVNFVLGTGQSQTFNSEDLENGSSKGTGAFGDGAGRWYVTATAECGSFVGSALNRNLEDGTVTNLTPQNHGQGL